jgi:hypothetical protein
VNNVSKKDIKKILRRNKAILKKYKVNKVGIKELAGLFEGLPIEKKTGKGTDMECIS